MRTFGAIVLALLAMAAPAADISSYAIVQDNGNLRVQGREIRLYGIYIPPTGEACRFNVRPPQCASRAALALEFRIDGFVRCTPTPRDTDGTLVALCRTEGEDLRAYLLERGWALALPDAPFEYQALERIARSRGVGVWGFPIGRLPAR